MQQHVIKMAIFSLINVILYAVLLLHVFNIVEIKAEQTRFCTTNNRPHPRGLCMPTLANTLQNICGANNKRDTAPEAIDPFADITLDRSNALSYLTKREPGYNIVCECCFHVCTVSELTAYC